MSGTGQKGRWEFDSQGNCRFVPENGRESEGTWQNGTGQQWQNTNAAGQQWQNTNAAGQQWQNTNAAGQQWQNTNAAGQQWQNTNAAGQQRQSGSTAQKNNSKGDAWQWALIIGLFLIGGWPIAVILLILKSKGIWGGSKSGTAAGSQNWQNTARQVAAQASEAGKEVRQGIDRARQNVQAEVQASRAAAGYAAQQNPQRTGAGTTAAGNSRQKKRAWAQWAREHGLGHIALFRTIGAVITALFGLTLLLVIGESDLTEVMALLSFIAGGVTLLGVAGSRSRKVKRYQRYLTMIGAQEEVSVAAVAKTLGYSEKKVLRDFQDMLDRGIFARGYLDVDRQLLILREWAPPEEPVPEEPEDTAAVANASVAALRRIREINNNIADPAMSEKIDRIEALTAKILRLLEEKPEKESELRSFLSYYLPETMNILDRYAMLEAQGVDSSNIASAKQQIEDTTEKLVKAYETQLDKLFESDVLDISADLKVMETMLEKDGLTDDGLHL